jgi:cytochrome P450
MILSFLRIEGNYRESIKRRIQRQNLDHVDYMSFMFKEDNVPKTKEYYTRLAGVSLQVMFAGFGAMSDWYYSAVVYLLQNPAAYNLLVAEIRGAFETYDDIDSDKLVRLEHLNACLKESLRLMPSLNTVMPRLSPGAIVDGVWVAKGVCLSSLCSFMIWY